MNEEWRPVLGCESSYEVSNLGRVRSVDRVVNFTDGRVRPYKGKELKLKTSPYGYHLASIEGRWRFVHRLVLEAFIGPCPPGMECRHLDDNKTHNRLPNLCWGTRIENRADMIRNGKHHNARKTECIHGHPLVGENVYGSTGNRHCRTCSIERACRRYQTKVKLGIGTSRNNGLKDRTACIHGHPFDEANTYTRRGTTQRQCRACNRAAQKRRQTRIRNANKRWSA